jgi:predicted molibdopterin-dependent oxidoreductase YjgC
MIGQIAAGQTAPGHDTPCMATITVDGAVLEVATDGSLAGALLGAGIRHLRNSPRDGTPRGALCFMGVCQECAIMIDGRIQQACQVRPRSGMRVELSGVV